MTGCDISISLQSLLTVSSHFTKHLCHSNKSTGWTNNINNAILPVPKCNTALLMVLHLCLISPNVC